MRDQEFPIQFFSVHAISNDSILGGTQKVRLFELVQHRN